MIGEKICLLWRDYKFSKEEGDLLEFGDEEVVVVFGGIFIRSRIGKGGKFCYKIFSNYYYWLQLKVVLFFFNFFGVLVLLLYNFFVIVIFQFLVFLVGINFVVVVVDVGSCFVYYLVYECVFKGDVRRFFFFICMYNIGQKDNYGNIFLYFVVMLGNKECVYLFLVYNVLVKVKNVQGWSFLVEVISYGDRQMIIVFLRKFKQ